MIQWSIEDDNGVSHPVVILNSFLIPNAPSKLLLPQHWAQMVKDNKPRPQGTWCSVYDDVIILEWGQRKNKQTLKLDK